LGRLRGELDRLVVRLAEDFVRLRVEDADFGSLFSATAFFRGAVNGRDGSDFSCARGLVRRLCCDAGATVSSTGSATGCLRIAITNGAADGAEAAVNLLNGASAASMKVVAGGVRSRFLSLLD
jgi:hypothetical protein